MPSRPLPCRGGAATPWKDFWAQVDACARVVPETRAALKEFKGQGVRWLGVKGGGVWKVMVHAWAKDEKDRVLITAMNGRELLAKVRAQLQAEADRKRSLMAETVEQVSPTGEAVSA